MHNPPGATGSVATLPDMTSRFLTLQDVAEVLNTTHSQVYALVRGKQLRAVKIGGRGQWRVEASALEDYVQRLYTETEQWIDAHPFAGTSSDEDD